MNEQNVASVKRGYELFGKGDLDALRGLFTQDVVWRTVHTGVFDDEYTGIDAVFRYFAVLHAGSGGTFKSPPVHIVADDERAFSCQHMTASREGRLFDMPMIIVFEIRDGRVFGGTEFAVDTSLVGAFWT